MRLLAYNIHKGIGGQDRRYRLNRIIDVIRNEKPDIICLQEVDQNVQRSHYHDQPKLLADECGLSYKSYQLTVPIKVGGYGNLVMSRWPLHQALHLCLRFRERKPRGAQFVVLETPEGSLNLVNWHLGLTGRERIWQAQRLITHSILQDSKHLPTLVVGDANDWRNQLSRRIFTDHSFQLATTPPSRFRSFPAYWPMLSLDKLFFRGAIKITHARMVRTLLARRASDHLPLVVDFELLHKSQNGGEEP